MDGVILSSRSFMILSLTFMIFGLIGWYSNRRPNQLTDKIFESRAKLRLLMVTGIIFLNR